MATLLLSIPVKTGQTDAARAFVQEFNGPRGGEFDASERRIGITAESWYLQHVGDAELLTVYLEGADLNASLTAFSASQDPFDRWFMERLTEITGVDISAGPPPPEAIAETLGEYRVGVTTRA